MGLRIALPLVGALVAVSAASVPRHARVTVDLLLVSHDADAIEAADSTGAPWAPGFLGAEMILRVRDGAELTAHAFSTSYDLAQVDARGPLERGPVALATRLPASAPLADGYAIAAASRTR